MRAELAICSSRRRASSFRWLFSALRCHSFAIYSARSLSWLPCGYPSAFDNGAQYLMRRRPDEGRGSLAKARRPAARSGCDGVSGRQHKDRVDAGPYPGRRAGEWRRSSATRAQRATWTRRRLGSISSTRQVTSCCAPLDARGHPSPHRGLATVSPTSSVNRGPSRAARRSYHP